MNPDSWWYSLLGAVAGGLAGALVMGSRRLPAPGSGPFQRRGCILVFGSGSVPWIVRWAIHGHWATVGAALLVHAVLNVAPVLHLRLAIWRIDGCRRWQARRRPARTSP